MLRWTATQLDEGQWKVEWKTDDLYTIILKIYYTLYTIKLKICTQRFLLFFFQIFKVYSRYVSSSSVAGLCLFAKGEVKNLSKAAYILAVSNVTNPVGLVCLPYVMWSAHFFVTHIQTEKISSWNGPTVHVCCFMLARASTKTFVSRVRKTAKKIFVSRKIR